MRRALIVAIGLLPAIAAAEGKVEIQLITMGPGDHLFTRGGHASIAVVKKDAAGEETSVVYNYGDADWKNPRLEAEFFLGTLKFFLGTSGSLELTVAKYGLQQNRTIYSQRLALTDAQARALAARLEKEALPENREYPYHHLHRICTTRIRDLLDEVFGGALRKQLAERHPKTIRYYHADGFTGYHLAFLASDLFMGRIHDQPIDNYFATVGPILMRKYFQQVMVPDPGGSGKRVPLVAPPKVLRKRVGPPPIAARGHTTLVFALIMLGIVLGFGAGAFFMLPDDSRLAGAWLLLWSLPVGLIGLVITALVTLSGVPELRANELILVFWPTDLLLIGLAIRWLRGRPFARRPVRVYAAVRLAAALLMVVGQLTGVLYQRPIVLAIVGASCAAALFAVLLRAPKAPAPAS